MLSKEEGQARAARARAGRGRPLGSCNLGSKQLSGLAMSWKKHGFDWRADFMRAVQARDTALMNFYLKLMPFLTTQNPGYRKNGGRQSPHAKPMGNKLKELEAQEQAARSKLTPLTNTLPLNGGEDYTGGF